MKRGGDLKGAERQGEAGTSERRNVFEERDTARHGSRSDYADDADHREAAITQLHFALLLKNFRGEPLREPGRVPEVIEELKIARCPAFM